MRILCLTARLPYPPDRGDRLRAYNFIRTLSREHRLTLLSFIAEESETGNVAGLRPFCESIQLVHLPEWQSALAAGSNAWKIGRRALPLQALYYRSAVMQNAVDTLLRQGAFDAVYVHLFRMAQYVTVNKGAGHTFGDRKAYRIVDLTDVISEEIKQSLPYRSPRWRSIYRMELPRIARYEQLVAREVEETWFISEAERQTFTEAGGRGNLQVVPNGVDLERFRPLVQQDQAVRHQSSQLAFSGHMSVPHNVDAAEFLAREIFPLVRRQCPTATLKLIGASPAPRVRALAALPGVSVTGHVLDLNAALNAATVFIAPLRFATGVQNKVLEAMAAGVPVVTTPRVNTGLAARPDHDLLIGEDAPGLAELVIQLLGDPARCRQLGAAGRRFALQHFSWEAVADRARAIEQTLSGKAV